MDVSEISKEEELTSTVVLFEGGLGQHGGSFNSSFTQLTIKRGMINIIDDRDGICHIQILYGSSDLQENT